MTTPPPGYGYPPPPIPQTPPKQPMSTSQKVAITITGLLLAPCFLGLALIPFLGDDDKGTTKPVAAATSSAPSTTPSSPPATKKPATSEPRVKAPIQLVAKNTKFKPSVLHNGGTYTSVKITITNNTEERISINVLDFAITDTKGGKHVAELGKDANQLDLVDLAPGEHVTGTVTGKGKFTPKYVTFSDTWFDEPVRVQVS